MIDVEDIDFEKLKQEIEKQEEFVDEDGNKRKEYFLGSVFYLTPSGKYYTFWACSNVSDEEIEKDQEWWDKLESEAEKHNIYITCGADPCDVLAGIVIENDKDDED